MKGIKEQCCRNCLHWFRSAENEMHYCRRYPKPMEIGGMQRTVDQHFCGEFSMAWMPIGEAKKRHGDWIQMWAHRRVDKLFVYTNQKGEVYSEEEYRAISDSGV